MKMYKRTNFPCLVRVADNGDQKVWSRVFDCTKRDNCRWELRTDKAPRTFPSEEWEEVERIEG